MNSLQHLIDTHRPWAAQISRQDPEFFQRLARQQFAVDVLEVEHVIHEQHDAHADALRPGEAQALSGLLEAK